MTSIRERLKALVEEWRDIAAQTTDPDACCCADTKIGCADDLAALLAEGDGEPDCSAGHNAEHVRLDGDDAVCTRCHKRWFVPRLRRDGTWQTTPTSELPETQPNVTR